MASYSTKTCAPCRRKKVKCDGNPVRCGPCQRSRKQVDCIYDHSPYFNRVPRLSKGQACEPCGRKKKKCDGARPYCRLCQVARKEHQCTYPVVKISRKRRNCIKSVLSCAPGVCQDGTICCKSGVLRSPVSGPSHFHFPSDFESKWTLFVPPSNIAVSPYSFATPISQAKFTDLEDYQGYFINEELSKPYNLSSFESIISQLSTYDPFLAGISEVSPVSLWDSNMKFRLMFLSHRHQNGFQFTIAKQQAILIGDTTHTFIHPFFIHFANMFGCNLYQEREKRYMFLHISDVHLRSTLAALTEVAKDDPFSFAQACFLMSLYLTFNQNSRLGVRFMRMAIDTIERNDIRFVPSYGVAPQDYPLECTEDVVERASFLSDLMYSEVIIALLLGENKSGLLLLSDLGRQFKHDLPAAYPDVFRTCPIVLRLGAVLLVTEAAALLSMYERDTMPQPSWFHSCNRHLTMATTHFANVLFQAHHSRKNNEMDHCISLQYTNFVLSLSLAEIGQVLDRHPLSLECTAKCKSALQSISLLLNDLTREDMEYLLQVMTAHWARTVVVFGNSKSPTTRSWYPVLQVPSCSIFANASLFLMASSQNKLANIRLNDAFPVCEELEDYLQRHAFKRTMAYPSNTYF